MHARKNRWAFVAFLLLALPAGRMLAKPPEPEGDRQFWVQYNAGLMAMREDRLPDAVAQFTQALSHSPDPRVYLARAAAYTLQEKFPEAIDDLSHASERPQAGERPSREPRLWRIVIWAMSDIPPDDAQANGIGGQIHFAGMPGNIVQGGDDYPTDYASQLAYELAMAYRQAKQNHGDVHAPELLAQFKRAAAWFANRKLASAPMAAFNLQYASEMLDKDRLPEALDAVNLAEVVYPFDADIRFTEAEAYRRMGRPETARRDYTIALTMQTDMAAGYRGRALAAAAEGDAKRALDDVQSAASCDPGHIAETAAAVNTLLSQHPAPIAATPAELLEKLDAAAKAGQTVDKLLPLAADLERASTATCLRYDEIYQSHLRELEDATRAKPGDPNGWVAFAGYILDEVRNRGENVEPRRPTQYYRYQYSQEMEISRAQFALNKALAIDPNHVGALVRMAYAYDDLNQSGKAQDCINKVLTLVGPQDADAIRLLAEYQADQAGSMQSRAHYLRSPHFFSSSHTEDRSDGVYEVTVTTRVDPTGADIQQADTLDAQARALIAQARQFMETAIKANPGTLEGMLLQASYQNWFGSADEALGTLQAAVKKYPTSLKAHDALTDYYIVHGMDDQAIEERMAAAGLFQTTAGPLLERIWRDIHQNGWPPLMADLERARVVNPADARITFYLAAAQADAKDKQASDASLCEAIALEKARLALDDQGESARMPRDASDLALLIRLLSTEAVHASQGGNLQDALAAATEAVQLVGRFGPGGKGKLMYAIMLPNQKEPEFPVPAPINGATLAAQTYVALGEIQQAAGDNAAALSAFRTAVGLARPYKSNIPRVGNARGDTNFSEDASGPVVVIAFMELARADIAAGDFRAAADALNNAGQNGPDRQQSSELNDLQMQVAQRINSQPQQAPQSYYPPGYSPYQQPPNQAPR